MSTPCTIAIAGLDFAQLYVHWDGDPDHMLPWLKSFNSGFAAARGDDPEYKFAQLLRDSVREAERFNLNPSDYTGYGVVQKGPDMGAQYHYALHADGSVTWEPT